MLEVNHITIEREKIMNKKVGISGLGFIGSTLVNKLLNLGYEVVGIDNRFKDNLDNVIPFITNKKFKFILGDISEIEDTKKFCDEGLDFIFWSSALVGFPICNRFKDLAYSTNVKGCENIVKYKDPKTKLIYPSTGSVYAPGQDVCTELSEVSPPSWYGKTKLWGEQAILHDKNSIVFRLATACGVGFSTLRVNLLMNDLLYKASIIDRSITIFEHSFKRVFINVADIIDGIILSIENFDNLLEDENRIYNLGNNDMTYTKGELANYIKERTGCHVIFADIMNDLDKRDYGYSSLKFNSKTNFQPKIGLEQTITDLIKIVPLLTPWNRYN